MMNAHLKAENLGYIVDEKILLDEIYISVPEGKVTALVGPNGAGKSTLLNMLAGDLEPTQGRVKLYDKDIQLWMLRDMASIRAVLSQNYELRFPFTASQVVAMGGAYVLRADEIDDAVSAALAEMRIGQLAQRDYRALSGGEKQRVQMARVLVQLGFPKPRRGQFLLLDEPTSALDIAAQHHLLHTVRSLSRSFGIGVLLVVHDINLASSYADRIGVLDGGRLIALDDTEKVLNASLLSRVFRHPIEVMSLSLCGINRLTVSRPVPE